MGTVAQDTLRLASNRLPIGGDGPGPDRARASITIGRPPEELLELLRRPETWLRLIALPEPPQLTAADERGVRWSARPGAAVHHEGSITLRPAMHGRGTVATVEVHLPDPGAVDVSALTPLATHPLELLPRFLARKVGRRLKSLAETGEVPTLEHNPHAPRPSRG